MKDKSQEFAGLAENYEKARPTYPKEMFDDLIDFWNQNKIPTNTQPIIADVGCGTGISTRAIYHAFEGKCKVYGIEPGNDMRITAEAVTQEPIIYINGSAESIPLLDASIDIVTTAQAVQWFDRPKFYVEVHRILKEGGVVAIYENNRDWKKSRFLEKYEELLEQYAYKDDGSQYSRFYRDFSYDEELKS
ncbi:MAG: class I SAM-dependent methyltransferase, partial [Gammaproteobacteria bacterium]